MERLLGLSQRLLSTKAAPLQPGSMKRSGVLLWVPGVPHPPPLCDLWAKAKLKTTGHHRAVIMRGGEWKAWQMHHLHLELSRSL